MQWFTLAFATLAVFAMCSARTIPNGMVFYQSAPVYYKRSAPVHRMMYVQYLPQHASRRSATAGGVSAFAAGDTIATGTYLRENNEYSSQEKAAVEYQPEIPQDPVSDQGAVSIAEAYPEQNLAAPEQLEAEEPTFENDPLKITITQPEQQAELVPETPQPTLPPQDPTASLPEVTESAPEVIIEIKKEKTPKQLVPQEPALLEPEPTGAIYSAEEAPANEIEPQAEEPAELPVELPVESPVESPVQLPVEVPVQTPAASPAKAYIPPKKKIRVELEAPESTEYEDEPQYYVPQYHKKNKAVAPTKRPSSLPAGTFFPIDFGGASGGAIAIANSFSTGEGGSATSTATAYGSPAVARSKAARKRLAQQ